MFFYVDEHSGRRYVIGASAAERSLFAGGEAAPAFPFRTSSIFPSIRQNLSPTFSSFFVFPCVVGRAMFRVTSRLLDCRITLFTRVNCSLCDTAKAVVGSVREKKPFIYQEIDVMEAGQEQWKAVYEFDTPVVSKSDQQLLANAN